MNNITAHPNASLEWLARREYTRQLHEVSRAIEMDMDRILTLPEWQQFARDVRMFNLYEAVLMLPKDKMEVAQTLIAETFGWFEETLISLPVGKRFEHQERAGKDITPRKTPITPSITWNIRKDEIREKEHLVWEVVGPNVAISITGPPQTWFGRWVKTLCRQIPAKAAGIENACRTDLWLGVNTIPADIRERAKAQLLERMSIAPAIDAYADGKMKVPNPHERERPDRVFLTDQAGNAWVWNCGWRRVREDGTWLDNKPPLGWLTFRRHIKLATLEELGRASFRYTRPWGMWRRGTGRFEHNELGNVELIHTDGVHAVVKLDDGTKREVVFDNLHAIGLKIARHGGNDKKSSGVQRPKADGRRKFTQAQQAEIDELALLISGVL